MNSKKQFIKNLILFIVLIVITFGLIFKNYSFKETISLVLSVDYKYIIIAIITMILSLIIQSINIKYLLSVLNKKIPLFRSLRYTLISFFGSGITPGGSGGQPLAIYFMKEEGIPVAKSTLTLLIELCSFHIASLVIGLIGVVTNYQLFRNELLWLFIVGITLKLIVMGVLFIGLFYKKASVFLVNLFIKLMTVFKYNKVDQLKKRIDSSIADYHEGATFIKKHPLVFVKSTIIVCFQVMMYYMVACFVYLSFGLKGYSFIKLLFISAMLNLVTSSIPLPGTVGVSESSFLRVYLSIYGIEKLAGAMLLTRGVNFYLFMFISFFVLLYSALRIKKKTTK